MAKTDDQTQREKVYSSIAENNAIQLEDRPDLSLSRISDQRLAGICKYHQPGVCRYIVYLPMHHGFYCGKKLSGITDTISKQADTMFARGDNCEGLP